MPDRDYVSLIFSQPLANAAPARKVDALQQLYGYLAHNGIAVGDADVNLGEIAEDLFGDSLDLTGHFQSGILEMALETTHHQAVSALGFSVRQKEALARVA